MVKTLTARYDLVEKAEAAYRDLVNLGIERERLYLQEQLGILKVHAVPSTEAQIRAILNRHEPNGVTEFTPS